MGGVMLPPLVTAVYAPANRVDDCKTYVFIDRAHRTDKGRFRPPPAPSLHIAAIIAATPASARIVEDTITSVPLPPLLAPPPSPCI